MLRNSPVYNEVSSSNNPTSIISTSFHHCLCEQGVKLCYQDGLLLAVLSMQIWKFSFLIPCLTLQRSCHIFSSLFSFTQQLLFKASHLGGTCFQLSNMDRLHHWHSTSVLAAQRKSQRKWEQEQLQRPFMFTFLGFGFLVFKMRDQDKINLQDSCQFKHERFAVC